MHHKLLVYLAGPISHRTYCEATGWRARAKQVLEGWMVPIPPILSVDDAGGDPLDRIIPYGSAPKFETVTPLRGKEFLAGQTTPIDPNTDPSVHLLASDQAINQRDSWDVRRCDVLLANLEGADHVSIGTVCEIADAWNLGKYVVLAMESGNCHAHPFLRARASIILPTLEEALRYMTEVL